MKPPTEGPKYHDWLWRNCREGIMQRFWYVTNRKKRQHVSELAGFADKYGPVLERHSKRHYLRLMAELSRCGLYRCGECGTLGEWRSGGCSRCLDAVREFSDAISVTP